jgi:hypothetical protein
MISRTTSPPALAIDSGEAKRDGGSDAGRLVASLKRGGCSCEWGGDNDAALSWLLLVGPALLVRRPRRRRS